MKCTLYLFFCIMFLLPSKAYAYLDPGTGNAMIYVIISFASAVIFSLKSIFYKIIGRKLNESLSANNKHTIVIYSEGKIYWNTFKPIIDALIERKVNFCYYTMDIDDPCLGIDNPYMYNKYIGNGYWSYVKIGRLKADIVLSTTPNIGTKGYPIPRSPNIKKLVHVHHSMDGLACYHRFSLDNYDAVLTVGDYEKSIIRHLEKIRNLKAKELYTVGLPYTDLLIEKKNNSVVCIEKNSKTTLLLAPSWGNKSFLNVYGSEFINLLAEADFDIIIRPHPYSMKFEKDLIDNAVKKLSCYDNICWDYDIDGTVSFMKADILISDASTIRFDFLLLYQKPVITLDIPMCNMQSYEVADMEESWLEKNIDRLGYRVTKENIDSIVDIVKQINSETNTDMILEFREKNVANWGHAGVATAEYLINAVKN